MKGEQNSGALDRYVPRVLLRRLLTDPDELVVPLEGSVVFVDVSGFTKLSERLARRGKEGAEHLTDAINTCFTALLADAYANGGALLKFGGDALLLWFEGEDHPVRACASALGMRTTLRSVGRIRTGSSQTVLRMSAGVHSGSFDTFLVGDSHREYVIGGPGASVVVEMEGAASAGQILLSPETAHRVPREALGSVSGPGVLLARSPAARPFAPTEDPSSPPEEAVASCLSTEIRAHVVSAPAAPEHRMVTVSFIQFGGLDDLIIKRGRAAAAEALDALVRTVQEAADLFQVCFLGSDITAEGGKLILTAGAPRSVGDDEERMLVAVRHVIENHRGLPIRIGVNRGRVFAGEIGPHYRRTYSVMGDTVNLAARLMAKAPWGSVYATEDVLDRSQTKFESRRLKPFMVKGKAKPIDALEVGALARPAAAGTSKHVPLIGRDAEYAALREGVQRAARGEGSLVEIVGETGSGKSRLLSEARQLGSDLRFVHATCESYRQGVPYVIWREILRQLLGLGWDDPDLPVILELTAQVRSANRDLEPWLPLLGIVIDAQIPKTREVEGLGENFRAAKLHEVVLEFLAPMLKVPTLLQIEHAHMMDEASAALLLALQKRLRWSSWMVAVTRRDAENGFVAPRSAKRLELGPLSPEAARELAEATPESHIVPPHVLDQAVERAGGSPEFLLDLLAAAADGSGTLPDSIDAAASTRIDALAPADRTLVRRASVLGLSFHPRRLRHVLDDEPDERTWERLGPVFARDPDGGVRFKRPAVCEVAYEGLPFRVRRELHKAVADALERELGRDVDADPAVLSLHFSLAGEHSRAWKYALMGAERAKARFAQVDAARLYRRAIEAAKSNGVKPHELAATWEALGEALRISGEPAAAVHAFTAARRLLPHDAIAQARLCYRHADVAGLRERLVAAVRWAKRGLRTLEDVKGKEAARWRVQLLSRLAGLRERQGRQLEAERLCREAIPEAERIGERRALAYLCLVLDTALFRSGRLDEPANWTRALEIYRELDDPENESKVLNNMCLIAHMQGRWDEVVELLEEAAACSHRAGNPADAAVSDLNTGEILSDQGRLDEAAVRLRRARRVFSATGDRQILAHVNLTLGRNTFRAGDPDEGLALMKASATDLRRFGLDRVADFADALVAEAEALGGSAERAVTMADRLLESPEAAVPLLRRARAMALVRMGDLDSTTSELELAVAAARERGEQYELVLALDALERFDGPSTDRQLERDAILARLNVVRLPDLPGPEAEQPVALVV